MKEQSAIGSALFDAFPSDCIRKATKDVNVLFFFSKVAIPVKYTKEFRELSEVTM